MFDIEKRRGRTIIYDGECSACAKLIKHIEKNKTVPGISFEKLQEYDFAETSPEIEKTEAEKSVIYITDNGRVLKGADAIAAIMKQMGGLRKFFGILMSFPPVKEIAALCYRLFARHRHTLSRYIK